MPDQTEPRPRASVSPDHAWEPVEGDQIEAVARAIAYSGTVKEKRQWDDLLHETREHYRDQARAAIAAMDPVRPGELDKISRIVSAGRRSSDGSDVIAARILAALGY